MAIVVFNPLSCRRKTTSSNQDNKSLIKLMGNPCTLMKMSDKEKAESLFHNQFKNMVIIQQSLTSH